MANYYDKKKLIEDNSDIYISEFDKALHPSALSGIIESKREYANAEKSGNTAAMKQANNKANTIRARFGAYSGGIDGSEYNQIPQSYEIRNNTSYTSPYDKQIKNLTKKINAIPEFEYNPETDPLYKVYQSIYTKLGEDAADRAMSQNALRSGGVNSSSAISAASLAQNKYNSMLAAKIPELYEASLKKYEDTYNRLFKELETITALDDTMYSRYRDEITDFENDRKYYSEKDQSAIKNMNEIYETDSYLDYNIQKDAQERAYKKLVDDRDYDYKVNKDKEDRAYQKERDEIADLHWGSESDQKNLSIAVDLAKALYGKVPVSSSVIKKLLSYIN